VICVLCDKNLRERAAVINQEIVADRADIRQVKKIVRNFYKQFK